MGLTDGELKQLAMKMGEDVLREAFRRKPFSYGTTGKWGGMVPPTDVSLSTHSSQKKWEPPAYNPGPRTGAVDGGQLQMMDMYYGNGGRLTDSRDPVISDFVLAATGLTGFGNDTWAHKRISPRLAYMAKFGNAQEGWAADEPGTNKYGVTTTKEISRIIRWGLGEYGGTLVFDGAEVNYQGVFLKKANPRDTDLEARGLFKHFRPGFSRAEYGNGNATIIFHWYSVETIPSLLHFASTWKWDRYSSAAKLRMDRRNFISEKLGQEEFWGLPPGQWRTQLCKMKLTSYANGLLEDTWANFAALPPLDIGFEQQVRSAP